MTTWEYSFIVRLENEAGYSMIGRNGPPFVGQPMPMELPDLLYEMGRLGWEMCGCEPGGRFLDHHQQVLYYEPKFYFKRPLVQ